MISILTWGFGALLLAIFALWALIAFLIWLFEPAAQAAHDLFCGDDDEWGW